MNDLANRIAARLLEEYEIGTSSRFCDEPASFDYVDQVELAEVIQGVIDSAQLDKKASAS